MVFHNDDSLVCSECGCIISAPTKFIKYKEECYCNEECLKDALFDAIEDDTEVMTLESASDHEDEYLDYLYDKERDDEYV